MPKKLSKAETEYILSLKYDDLNRGNIVNLIADIYDPVTKKSTRKFNPNDVFILPENTCCNNKTQIQTTVGRYIFNRKVIEPYVSKTIGYFNAPITTKSYNSIISKISQDLLEDKITDPMAVPLTFNLLLWMSFEFIDILAPGLTRAISETNKDVMYEKKQLISKNIKAIEAGDAKVGSAIEKTLLNTAEKSIDSDIGSDLFKSGAIGSFSNNYKTLNVMKGPMKNSTTGEYYISTNCYNDGISKKDFPAFADQLVIGAYAKGISTQVGGYMTKKNLASFQGITLDEKGTDCGSKGYLTVLLSPFLLKLFMYNYIIEGKNLVLLNSENSSKYANKIVKVRSPMYCLSDKICNKCAGEVSYMLGISNIGLTIPKESTSLLNKSMKKFHDTSISLYTVDINTL